MALTLDTYAPFDSGPGADVQEDTWRKFMRHMIGSGVLIGASNQFEVFADSTGMQVKVRSGECWIRGHWGETLSEKWPAIASSHATLPRRDRVILRGDFVNNRIEIDVLTGTAAASPVVPALTQNTTKWEIPLAWIQVDAAVSTIASTKVTDERPLVGGDVGYGKHAWQGSGSVPTGTIPKVTSFTAATTNSSIATLSSGNLLLNRAGRWTLGWKIFSDAGDSGKFDTQMQWSGTVGGFAPENALTDTRWRGGGFSGAGFLNSWLSWTGYVSPAAALSPVTMWNGWYASGGVITATTSYTLYAEYLGGR